MKTELINTMSLLAQSAGQAHAAFLETLSSEQASKLGALLEADGRLGAEVLFGTDTLTSTLYVCAPDGNRYVLHQCTNPPPPTRH